MLQRGDRGRVHGTYSEEKIAVWDGQLGKIFNRGFWNGYYLGQRLGEWSAKYGSSATRVKEYRAKGVRYFSNIGVAEFYMETGELHVGDEIVITGPTTGTIIQTVEEIRVGLEPVEKAVKGDSFSIAVAQKSAAVRQALSVAEKITAVLTQFKTSLRLI